MSLPPKAVLINRCARGILDGRGEIVVRAYENCSEKVWEGYLERYVDQPLEDTRNYKVVLPPSFWVSEFETAIPTGFAEPVSPFDLLIPDVQYWADWDIGDFGYRKIWTGGDSMGIERCDVAGLKFNSEQLALLAGAGPRVSIPPRARQNLYDWESAFIDIAGALSQGLLIPDAFAPGAQAKLEVWLASWFAENLDAYPNESTIRPKAKKILEAIRREQLLTSQG